MRKNKLTPKRGLMATTTLCGVVLTGAMAAGMAATVAALLPAEAEAQDYTSGAVIGSVSDSAGKPVSGATVTLTSTAQGQTRTLTSSTAGTFSATGLAPGEYSATVSAAGYDDYATTFSVVVSQEVRIEAALQTTGAAAQTVVVKGKRVRQDFAKTTTGLTVDLETLVKQQPIGRSLTSVMMLAPTVVKGNSGFGDVASIGGASVAENAYYINGLNITNPDTYISSAQVPFDFYKTVEVKTGGYSAEYGRATGGVVNATTKSGSNEFMMALHGNYAPNSMRAPSLDTYSSRGQFSSSDASSATLEASGALIKDKLFVYGMYSANDTQSTSAGINSGVYSTYKATDPFYGLKVDGYITPKQHLEFTYFSTKSTTTQTTYNYDDETRTVGDAIKNGKGYYKTGGDNYVLKYTGAVTDWFTISAAYGVSKDVDDFTPQNTTDYYVRQYINGSYKRTSTTQPFSRISTDHTTRTFYRLDGDMRFDALGHHHVRFGVDQEDLEMDKTTRYTGEYSMYYTVRNGYFYTRYGVFGGHVSSQNQAAYIQDSWDVTSKLNLQIGLRDDIFKQNNLSGEQYMDLKDNWGPRLGFSYDVNGDGSWRIYGNVGRYYIPPAMNLGYRGKDLYYLQYNKYDATATGAIDSTTGLPTGTGTVYNVGDSCYAAVDTDSAAGIPTGIQSSSSCVYYGDGTQEPANAKAAIGLKASSENEYILGSDYRINDLWSVGVNLTYRNLDQISEDTDFTDQINEWLVDNGYSTSDYTSTNNYYVWNPGSSVTIRLKSALKGETEQKVITLTGLTFPKAKREYKAMTLNFKRAFDGKWGLQGSYVWSRSHGNYEGTVKSDVGNGVQEDAGATTDYDYLGLTDNSTGLLPNHRAHTFKTFGSYAVTPQFMVGANLLVQSPAHLSCEGSYPDSSNAAFSYGAISYYCNGEAAPRGTGLKTDWLKTVDLSLRYTFNRGADAKGGLVLRADIFNLFNDKAVTGYYIQYEVGNDYSYTKDTNYGAVTSYTTPRYVRLGFDLTY